LDPQVVQYRLGSAVGVAVPLVERNVAILTPRVRDIEVVAHQCETARNVRRMRGRRWIEKQGMHPARETVVLEDTDVIDACRDSPDS
jgi:hypothetical protein